MKPRARPGRLALRLVELFFAVVFFRTTLHHVLVYDLRPLAALCVPILLMFFGFSSLLFVRGRALAEGPWQIRSLLAAERAMQATVWHLSGIILGITVYGTFAHFNLAFNANEPSWRELWLLVYLAPYALMQVGLLCFMRALWVITPQFFRSVSAFELRRRVDTRARSGLKHGVTSEYRPKVLDRSGIPMPTWRHERYKG